MASIVCFDKTGSDMNKNLKTYGTFLRNDPSKKSRVREQNINREKKESGSKMPSNITQPKPTGLSIATDETEKPRTNGEIQIFACFFFLFLFFS